MKKFFKKTASLFLSMVMVITCLSTGFAAYAKDLDEISAYDKIDCVKGEAIAVMKNAATTKSTARLMNDIDSAYSDITLEKSWVFDDSASAGVRSYSAANDSLVIAKYKSESLSTGELIKRLKQNKNVESVIANSIMKASDLTNDTYSKYQWDLKNNGQSGGTAGEDMNVQALWDKKTATDKESVVAIVDTGIDPTHEDLKDILWQNPYGSKLYGKYGCDFTGTNKNHNPVDDDGHGSHVAGTIAASLNNEAGIAGIADSNVKIMALKFLDENGEGETEHAIDCYDYINRAMELGTNVVAINNSWGGMGFEDEKALFNRLIETVGKKGAVSIIAAGNDSMEVADGTVMEDLPFMEDIEIYDVPASCDSEYAVKVAATDTKGELASFSNYSSKLVQAAAPGTEILSTVSYDCFNPSLYDAEKYNSLVAKGFDFETSQETPEVIDNIVSDGEQISTSAAKEITGEKYFGSGASGKSLKFKLDDSKKFLFFEIPYTAPDDGDYYVSFNANPNADAIISVYDVPADTDMAKYYDEYEGIVNDFASADCWTHITDIVPVSMMKEEDLYISGADRKLVFVVMSYSGYFDMDIEDGEGLESIYFDDIAISKTNVDASQFGKYDFYNGTSMAAPHITGAAAALSVKYPQASINEIISMISTTGNEKAALKDKTTTGKAFDFSKVEEHAPIINSIEFANNQIVVSGKFDGTETVAVDGADVTPVTQDSEKIILANNKYNEKKVSVTVTNQYGSTTRKILISSKKKFTVQKKAQIIGDVTDMTVLTAGETIYTVTTDGTVNELCYDDFEEAYTYMDIGSLADSLDPETMFESVYVGTAAYMDNKIYYIKTKPVLTSTGTSMGYTGTLGVYNLLTEKTADLCEIENGYIDGMSLAVFNGRLYLFGGYDNQNEKFNTSTLVYNANAKKFENTGIELAQPTAFGKCIQFKNKLIYAYGAVESGKMPKIQVFDGKTWTVSGIELDADEYHERKTLSGDRKLNVYNGCLGYGRDRVFCSGAFCYGIGDTFTYNAETDSIGSCACSISATTDCDYLFGTTVGGSFIGLAATGDFYSDSDMDDDDDDFFGMSRGMEFDDPSVTLVTLQISNVYPEFETDYFTDHCTLSAATEGAVPYGDKITVTAKPERGYKISAFYVNDKKVTSFTSNKLGVVVTGDTNVTAKAVLDHKHEYTVKRYTQKATATANGKVYDKYSCKYCAHSYNKTIKTIAKVSNIKLSQTTYTYDGKSHKPGVTVKDSTGKALKNGTDYTVKYASSCKEVGQYKATVTFKGNYTGSKILTYTIAPKKTGISSVSARSKAFVVKWAKQTSKTTGYQIQYSTDKNFKKNNKTALVTKNSTTSKTISALKAKTTYYVRIRTYKTVKVDGKSVKVYSSWSTAKSVKTR